MREGLIESQKYQFKMKNNGKNGNSSIYNSQNRNQAFKTKQLSSTRKELYTSQSRVCKSYNVDNESPDDLRKKLGIEIKPGRDDKNIQLKMPRIEEHRPNAEESNRKNKSNEKPSLNSLSKNHSLIINQFNTSPKQISHNNVEPIQKDEMKSSQLSLLKARSEHQKNTTSTSHLFEPDKLKLFKAESTIDEDKEKNNNSPQINNCTESKGTLTSLPSTKNFNKKRPLVKKTMKKTTSNRGFEKEFDRNDKNIPLTPTNEIVVSDKHSLNNSKTVKRSESNSKSITTKGEIDISLKNDLEIAQCLEDRMQNMLKLIEQIEKIKKVDLKPQKELFNKQLKVIIKKIKK